MRAMDTSVPVVTVSMVDAETPLSTAVIVVEPALAALAWPSKPAALLIEATEEFVEFQTTALVRFCVEPSE